MQKKEEINSDLQKINQDSISLLDQKEYLFTTPKSSQSILGTPSVRSCYCIAIYHPKKSCIMHVDDNTEYTQIDRVMKEFLSDELDVVDCTVTLIGGWADHNDSNLTGRFLKDFFEKTKCTLKLEFFQKKLASATSNLSASGFSLVLLDANDGAITISSDWGIPMRHFILSLDQGMNKDAREDTRVFLDTTHYRSDKFPNSGTKLYHRDGFSDIRTAEIAALCLASKDNNEDDLIKLLDEGITDVNASEQLTGYSPLHYACERGHFKIAAILLDHGADINVKNKNQKTPIELIKDNEEQVKKIKVSYEIAQLNKESSIDNGTGGLISYSLFSRRHPEQLSSADLEMIKNLKEGLDSPRRFAYISKSFGM